jgi:hypothetical protein
MPAKKKPDAKPLAGSDPRVELANEGSISYVVIEKARTTDGYLADQWTGRDRNRLRNGCRNLTRRFPDALGKAHAGICLEMGVLGRPQDRVNKGIVERK